MLKILKIHKLLTLNLQRPSVRCCSTQFKPHDVFIVSAVNEQVVNSPPLNAAHMSATIIAAALKEAALPSEEVQLVVMSNVHAAEGAESPLEEAALLTGLPKKVWTIASPNFSTKGTMWAAHVMRLSELDVVVVGGLETQTKCTSSRRKKKLLATSSANNEVQHFPGNMMTRDMSRQEILGLLQKRKHAKRAERAALAKTQPRGPHQIFNSLILQQKRKPWISSNPESNVGVENANAMSIIETPTLYDGAACLVLTTGIVVERLNLKPLARLIAAEEMRMDLMRCTTESEVAIGLINGNSTKNSPVHSARWKIKPEFPVMPVSFIEKLPVGVANGNIQRCTASVQNAGGQSVSNVLTQLVHELPVGQFGCVTIFNGRTGAGGALSILLEKLSFATNDLPALTLYTKDQCPLCDELVEELRKDFAGEYSLTKVDITKKENLGYLRLYRYDIPVLFLNGQFLCMHKLNANVLRRKLDELKSDMEKKNNEIL